MLKENKKEFLRFDMDGTDKTDNSISLEYDDDFSDYLAQPDDDDDEDITLEEYDCVTPNDDESDGSYELFYNHDSSDGNLSNVIGHENQKKEILCVIDWFNRSKELKSRGVSIPKGVILYGAPGNGKSLLIKEIIKSIDAPVLIFKGEKTNIVSGLIKTFNKAKELGHSIVVIDELDLLIDGDNRIKRTLQECLDGVESSDDILVLCATNDIRAIPTALKRNGRLEKIINIPKPNGDEALKLFKKCVNEFKIELPNDFDDDEYKIALNGLNFVAIKTIINDVILRNGFENITTKMLDDSINIITTGITDSEKESHFEVAVHEASHAVMANKFKEFFVINNLKMDGASGIFKAKTVIEDYTSFKQAIADIKVCMAGLIAEKVILKKGSLGSEDDLNKARNMAYHLYNCSGFSSCWEALPPVSEPGVRTETYIKRRKMEQKIEKLLKKCEKDVTKYVKRNTPIIIELANKLFEKKWLKSKEILSVIG